MHFMRWTLFTTYETSYFVGLACIKGSSLRHTVYDRRVASDTVSKVDPFLYRANRQYNTGSISQVLRTFCAV